MALEFDPADTPLVRNTKAVDHAHDTYTAGATGMPVQADHNARVAMANAPHTVRSNAQLGSGLNQALNAQGVPSYTGGNIITVAANRAGVDANPEDTSGVEDLEHEVLVKAAIDADALFARGGQIPPESYVDATDVSPYVDGTWQAEASKMTGEKFF